MYKSPILFLYKKYIANSGLKRRAEGPPRRGRITAPPAHISNQSWCVKKSRVPVYDLMGMMGTSGDVIIYFFPKWLWYISFLSFFHYYIEIYLYLCKIVIKKLNFVEINLDPNIARPFPWISDAHHGNVTIFDLETSDDVIAWLSAGRSHFVLKWREARTRQQFNAK